MGLTQKPSFTAGELDPSLWERTNLDKYRNGLAVARNWIISKTGSILTRQGRQYAWTTKLSNRAVLIYSPPGGGVLLEWGHLYVRVYSLTDYSLLADVDHAFTEDDLATIQFESSGSFVYIFCAGKTLLKFNYATYAFVAPASLFSLASIVDSYIGLHTDGAPYTCALTAAGTPTGYKVEYCITSVINGEETAPLFTVGIFGAGPVNLPIAAGQSILVRGTLLGGGASSFLPPGISVTEMKVYRRPYDNTNTVGGGAFGYIGSGTAVAGTVAARFGGVNVTASFVDIGGDADYTHQPPTSIIPDLTAVAFPVNQTPAQFLSNTGVIYQQRLLLSDFVQDLQAIYASRPGFQNNFYQNYPLDAASALKFKCGTSGYARILRLLDSDGLVAFTSAGVYLNQGSLNPDNITMIKKGKWIINPTVPPLPVPGGVMFLDASTNGVRNLLWSFQLNAFDADEVSIYSNHLFRSRQLNSWNFQQGSFPLLWCVFTDGEYASFTFDYAQQMQAWTRHNGVLKTKYSCGTTNPDQTFFVVAKTDPLSGVVTRYVEYTIPRYVPASVAAEDPDADKNASCAYMDGIVTIVNRVAAIGTTPFLFATTSVDDDGNPDWSGILNLTASTSELSTAITNSRIIVGSILRFFDEDGSEIDVKVLSIPASNRVQVQIDNTDKFPSRWATGATLYITFASTGGLTMFEGEYPAVICDGAVLCSPYNDQENYDKIQVSGGVFTLPANQRAAILHVGRPIIGDIMTLDIDTVEQSPTLLESLVVNKVYVKVKDSKGLYVGPKFPKDTGVDGMVPIDTMPVDYTSDTPLIGNRAQPSQTKRFEVMSNGDYSQQGKIAIRQVDPLHAEILSLIPDVEIHKRSDR